ncbi:aminodeoxychorismate synthase component I [Marinobacterium litorale]|uniref:aminodeoxychorismate synthase component I n=1 Tax=Marinobacterium litorale TaxID=404770 RepID=UPI0003FDE796|nr:aminodeoxychorismate synthase component I [Marinobacterium litorale]
MTTIYPLPYPLDTHNALEQLRPLGDAVLLDSAHPKSDLRFGRYDIISAAPDRVLKFNRGEVSLRLDGLWQRLTGDPVEHLKSLQQEIAIPADNANLPFCGGLIGYFSYDLGRAFEQLPVIADDDLGLAELRVGRYLWAVVIDHQCKTSQLVAHERADAGLVQQLHSLLNDSQSGSQAAPFKLKADFLSNLSRPAYMAAFDQVQAYILAGDCYQINLTQRFSAPCEGDPFAAFRALRARATTPFSAYLESEEGALLSLSPERFLKVSALGDVETRPIKGTRPRGSDSAEDRAQAEALAASEKDRAENLMIVDLLRNDLGKVCEPGSVRVPELFAIETYPNVHHLVSAVTGRLADNYTSLDLLKQCFPGGSITGAPKIRAMEIIDELEPHRRSIYCGSIGYISADGSMDTSICIRTLLVRDGKIHCWAGGGVVADSEGEAEYQESFDKVDNLLNTLRDL